MPKTTSILHKPIIDHILKLDRDIKWLLPVTYEQNELMALTGKKKELDAYDGAPTHIETDMNEFMDNLTEAQRGFSNTGAQTDANKYDRMMTAIDTLCAPAANRLDPVPDDVPIYLPGVEAKTATELMVSNDDKYQMDSSIMKKGLLHKSGKNTYTIRRYTGSSSRLFLDEATRKRAYQRKPIGSAPPSIRTSSYC